MTIGLASDHAGFDIKDGIRRYLDEKGISYLDYGCGSGEQVDYIDFAEKALRGRALGDCERLILVCGTGIGMSMVANKFRGVRATLCCDPYMADMSRRHNNSNCLTLGGRILPLDEALEIVEIWMNTDFEGERHQARLDKLSNLEDRNFKPST